MSQNEIWNHGKVEKTLKAASTNKSELIVYTIVTFVVIFFSYLVLLLILIYFIHVLFLRFYKLKDTVDKIKAYNFSSEDIRK